MDSSTVLGLRRLPEKSEGCVGGMSLRSRLRVFHFRLHGVDTIVGMRVNLSRPHLPSLGTSCTRRRDSAALARPGGNAFVEPTTVLNGRLFSSLTFSGNPFMSTCHSK